MTEVSVVIATRNRPALLRRALASVSGQSFASLEVIVVDDGSDPAPARENTGLTRSLGTRGAYHALPVIGSGHGPGFARNYGAAQARGRVLAFLDDDDEWIDPAYLGRAARALAAAPEAGLLYANQEAIRADGSLVPAPVWIEDLAGLLAGSARPQPDGSFLLSPAQALASRGFCHLNATVVRRDLFIRTGGFDPILRYEEDRDFQLRALDAAAALIHDPAVVARHYVPQRDSASTTMRPEQHALDRLRLLDKAILNAVRPEIRAHAQRHKAYTLKTLARRCHDAGDLETAAFYAREALGIGPHPKWLAWSAWLALKRRLRRTAPSSSP